MSSNIVLNRKGRSTAFSHRLLVLASSCWLVIALNRAHASYLYPIHEIWGFPYVPLDALDWLLLFMGTGLVALTQPLSLKRPSSLVMFGLYLLVYLPTMTLTLGVDERALPIYGPALGAMTLAFVALNLGLRSVGSYGKPLSSVPLSRRKTLFLLLVFLALLAFIVLAFRDVMSIVGLEEIYDQRAAGRSRNWAEAYAQTYLAYVFSPALLALGLLKRNWAFMFLGLLGFVVMFAVTAERTIFLLPFVMLAAHVAFRSGIPHALQMVAVLCLTAALITLSTTLAETSLVFSQIALYFVFRVVAVPGAMLWQYHEVFADTGYTFWSHVRGLGAVIAPPKGLEENPAWPQLGHIVAEYILDKESNSNANLFAYDGIAAAGPAGILVVGLVLGLWLLVLDRTARAVDWRFTSLVCLPMAFALVNGSLFSIMLSFGGLFWIAFWAFPFRAKSHLSFSSNSAP
jgi:hypothetical protein